MTIIDWNVLPPVEDPPRNYEIAVREKLWEEFAPKQHDQHFVIVSDPDCDVEDEDEEWCDCYILHETGRHIEVELEHPPTCDELEPGDGRVPCSVMHEISDIGFENLEEELKDRTGRIPIALFVESYGGYWEPREYDAYLMVGLEEEMRRNDEWPFV